MSLDSFLRKKRFYGKIRDKNIRKECEEFES